MITPALLGLRLLFDSMQSDLLELYRSASARDRSAWRHLIHPWFSITTDDDIALQIFLPGLRFPDICYTNWKIWRSSGIGEAPPAIPWWPAGQYNQDQPFIWRQVMFWTMPAVPSLRLAVDMNWPFRETIKPPRSYDTGKSRRRMNLPKKPY